MSPSAVRFRWLVSCRRPGCVRGHMTDQNLTINADPGAGGAFGIVALWLDRLIEFVCATLLVTTTGIAVLQVFYRYVLNNSLYWPEEAARWAFVWTVFLGMALGIARHGHIAIDILAARLKGRAQVDLPSVAPTRRAYFSSRARNRIARTY